MSDSPAGRAVPGRALCGEIERCQQVLSATLLPTTLQLVATAIDRFGRFLVTSTQAGCLADVTVADVELFVHSRTWAGALAATPTVHNRRTALRHLFRIGRQLGLVAGDPTLDLKISQKSPRPARPLNHLEVAVGRDVAMWSLTGQQYSLVWALAETTARGSELPAIGWRHVDLESGAVELAGAGRVRPRTGQLSPWGVTIVQQAKARQGRDGRGDTPIIYGTQPPPVGGAGWASNVLATILLRAGLAGKRDVRPTSITAWAGRQCWDTTGDIAAVARLLGLHSLDAAARFIGWDWTDS